MSAIEPIGILRSLNWVDVLALAVAVRIIFVSAQTGFVVEFFKLFGAVIALFVSFHYYSKLGNLINISSISGAALGTTAFIVLWLFTLLICKFIRDGFMMLFSVQAQNVIDKWGAAVIAIGRVMITVSMIMFLFLVTGQKYLHKMTATSMSSKYFLNVAPNIYRASCDHFITRLFPVEKKNPAVARALKEDL